MIWKGLFDRSSSRAVRRRNWIIALGALVGLIALWVFTLETRPAHPFYGVRSSESAESAESVESAESFAIPATDRALVIAHRGGAGLRPENTLAAFRHAVLLGVDVLEFDVQPVADGTLVVIHDDEVDRTTDGSGAVVSMRLQQLQSFDAGFHFVDEHGEHWRGRDIRIPTLEQVLQEFPAQRMLIELKAFDTSLSGSLSLAASSKQLCEALRRHGRTARTVVNSFDGGMLKAFRAHCPGVATGAGLWEAGAFWLLGKIGVVRLFQPHASVYALHLPLEWNGYALVTEQTVRDARRLQLSLEAWVVNEPEEMQAVLSLNPGGIMTDYPDRLLQLRSERSRPQTRN